MTEWHTGKVELRSDVELGEEDLEYHGGFGGGVNIEKRINCY